MGNHQSASMSCKIDKQTDLMPGEHVHGFVRLTVHQNKPLMDFDGIDLTIVGVEYILEEEETQDPTTRTSSSSSSSKTPKTKFKPTPKIVKLRYSIADFSHDNIEGQVSGERMVKKGDYLYPFEIELPHEYDLQRIQDRTHRKLMMTMQTPSKPNRAESTISISDTSSSSTTERNRNISSTGQTRASTVSFEGYESSTSASSGSTTTTTATTSTPPPSDPTKTSTSQQNIANETTTATSLKHQYHQRRMSSMYGLNDDDFQRLQDQLVTKQRAVVYKIRASLRRKPNVKLSVDTDIKCYAQTV